LIRRNNIDTGMKRALIAGKDIKSVISSIYRDTVEWALDIGSWFLRFKMLVCHGLIVEAVLLT